MQVGGRLRACLLGDNHVVNCLEQHPTLPLTLATSGAPCHRATTCPQPRTTAYTAWPPLCVVQPLQTRLEQQWHMATLSLHFGHLPELMSVRVYTMHFTAGAGVTAGIDNDVKIWAPTAVRAQEPAASPAVQRLLRDNSTGRGRSRAMQQVCTVIRMVTQMHITILPNCKAPCTVDSAAHGAQQHQASA
jgi:hypothetical protein